MIAIIESKKKEHRNAKMFLCSHHRSEQKGTFSLL